MGVIYFILGIMGAAYVIIGGGVFLVFRSSFYAAYFCGDWYWISGGNCNT